jgi:hypothetical protein
MILLSYGLTKSGSTLAFQIAMGILIDNGFVQERLPDHLAAPGKMNFLRTGRVARRQIDQLLSLVPSRPPRIAVENHCFCDAGLIPYQRITQVPSHPITAVKTHRPLDPGLKPYLEELINNRALVIHAIFRDPRDICLSLLDAGVRARRAGRCQFSEIATLDDAIECVAQQLQRLRTWGSIRGVSLYDYDQVAFEMDATIERMAADLRLTANRDAVKHFAACVFTQKNKARRKRHENELTPEQNARCLKKFGPFIEEVIVNRDYAWFHAGPASQAA